MVDVDFSRNRPEASKALAMYESLCGAARTAPGVAHAACSPAVNIGFRALTTVIDAPEDTAIPEQERVVHKNLITPEWFQAFGTRLLAGRDFSSIDRVGAPRVAVVNEAFAERFLKTANAVGRIVREDRRAKGKLTLEIVGVVENAVYRSVREPPPATIYLPLAQEGDESPFPWLNVVIRPSSGPPASVAAGVVGALAEVDGNLRLTIRPMEDQVNATFNRERVLAMVPGVFGGLALLLAALGLYGVMAYAVSCRRREIGIRMALGADSRRVVCLVLGNVAGMVGLGIAAGAVLSLWATQFVQSLLFGLAARDEEVVYPPKHHEIHATVASRARGLFTDRLPERMFVLAAYGFEVLPLVRLATAFDDDPVRIAAEHAAGALDQIEATIGPRCGRIPLHHDAAAFFGLDERRVHVASDVASLGCGDVREGSALSRRARVRARASSST